MAVLIDVTSFLNRCDIVSVSRLCFRGTPGQPLPTNPFVTTAALQTDPVLAAALADASGLVISGAVQGGLNLYTEAALLALTGNMQARLFRLLARLAVCLLWEDRALGGGDVPRPQFYDQAYAELARLQNGERVFS